MTDELTGGGNTFASEYDSWSDLGSDPFELFQLSLKKKKNKTNSNLKGKKDFNKRSALCQSF